MTWKPHAKLLGRTVEVDAERGVSAYSHPSFGSGQMQLGALYTMPPARTSSNEYWAIPIEILKNGGVRVMTWTHDLARRATPKMKLGTISPTEFSNWTRVRSPRQVPAFISWTRP